MTIHADPVQRRFNELLAARWRASYTNDDPNARTSLWGQAQRDVKLAEAEERRTAGVREQAERETLRRAIAYEGGDLANLFTRVADRSPANTTSRSNGAHHRRCQVAQQPMRDGQLER